MIACSPYQAIREIVQRQVAAERVWDDMLALLATNSGVAAIDAELAGVDDHWSEP